MIAAVSGVGPQAGSGIADAGRIGGGGAIGRADASAAMETDFAQLLGEAVANLATTLKQAETVSVGGIQGSIPMQEVVETVMGAEQSLQAAIAVRDKIVAAYLEISRMAI